MFQANLQSKQPFAINVCQVLTQGSEKYQDKSATISRSLATA